jgi:hypothetical protein
MLIFERRYDGIQTASIDKTLKAVEKAGGKIVTPKHTTGLCGKAKKIICWFKKGDMYALR